MTLAPFFFLTFLNGLDVFKGIYIFISQYNIQVVTFKNRVNMHILDIFSFSQRRKEKIKISRNPIPQKELPFLF